MARLLRLLLLCLWPLGPLWASDILLVGGEDQPGIRSFVAAVESHRPQDRVRFQTTADLPRPGRLKADQRLVLLDSAALEWRLSESAGPPALAMRVSRVQAEQRLGKSRPAFLTLLWSDPPLARQLRLARYLLPQAQRIGVLYGKHSAFCSMSFAMPPAPWAWRSLPRTGPTHVTAGPCNTCWATATCC